MSHPLPRKSAGEALAETVPLKGRHAVDIGSGDGTMVRFLTEQGAKATGVECGVLQLEKAHAAERVGDEHYLEGVGQAMPLADASADIVTFINSLHHVPVAEMGKALEEAARVLVDGGDLFIAEPLAEGPLFELVQPIDDETEVRAAAYAQIQRAGEYGFEAVSESRFLQARKVESFDAIRDMMISIDPSRKARVEAMDAELRANFQRLAPKLQDGRHELVQPIRVNVLKRRPRPPS